jgi:hypothetical protein
MLFYSHHSLFYWALTKHFLRMIYLRKLLYFNSKIFFIDTS